MTPSYSDPLNWPAGHPRTPHWKRKSATFKVELRQAEKEMLAELAMLGGKNVVISSDRRVNRDGSLYAGRQAMVDVGIAVYFDRKDRRLVLACDKFDELKDNLRAIGKTLEAMRGIERWGASDMLDRAFTGFEALPAPEQWWQVLGLSEGATVIAIEAAWRALAKEAHPDRGGSDAAMSRINVARDQGLAARGGAA